MSRSALVILDLMPVVMLNMERTDHGLNTVGYIYSKSCLPLNTLSGE